MVFDIFAFVKSNAQVDEASEAENFDSSDDDDELSERRWIGIMMSR